MGELASLIIDFVTGKALDVIMPKSYICCGRSAAPARRSGVTSKYNYDLLN